MSDPSIRILLVEDDEDDAIVFRELLQQVKSISFEMKWVDDFEEGLAEICNAPYDVCMLDYRLGSRTGLSFLSEARAGCAPIPIILLTGFEDYRVDVEAMHSGAADYLVKGQLTPELIERSIRYAIASKKAEDDLKQAQSRLEQLVAERTAELAETNAALKMSEEWLRSIIKAIPDIVYRLDAAGAITFVSDAVKTYGFSPQELVRKPFLDLVYPEDRQAANYKVNERRTGDRQTRAYEIRLDFKGKQKSPMTFLISAEGLYASDRPNANDFLGTQGIARDITVYREKEREKKELERNLQVVQRMQAIETLAGGVAHDFNNILMGILGNVSLILTAMPKDNPNFEKIKNIESYAMSAAELTKQLLGFGRGGKYMPKPLNLNHLLKKNIQMFSRTRKDLTIETEFEDGIWAVQADQSQIDQALLNIYVNASQAMPRSGTLRVRTRNTLVAPHFADAHKVEPGRYVWISISDTGGGIDPKTLHRIFEPFFTTKKLGRGTGLGLASTYGIVRNHRGLITVESTKDRGTTFHIYLPASDAAPAASKDTKQTPLAPGSETILLIDDEEMIRNVGSAMLRRLGYTVIIAASGREGIDILKKRPGKIDLVILDVVMPEMDGEETFEELRKIDPKIKILLSSGYSFDEKTAHIIRRGGSGFIQKPFDLKTLSDRIREIFT